MIVPATTELTSVENQGTKTKSDEVRGGSIYFLRTFTLYYLQVLVEAIRLLSASHCALMSRAPSIRGRILHAKENGQNLF